MTETGSSVGNQQPEVSGSKRPTPMDAIWNLNLIRFFDFYLAVAFLLSTYRRFGQYRSMAGLVMGVPSRWPRLLELIHNYRAVFLTRATLLPALLALALIAVQMICSRLLWPQADLTLAGLVHRWIAMPVVVALGLAMTGVDLYFIVRVTVIDRPTMEGYLDQAEFWLKSWRAPVVRAFTFGRIDPRRMVTTEVQKAMVEASRLLNATLWWVTLQIGLRVSFGLALWLAYAFGD